MHDMMKGYKSSGGKMKGGYKAPKKGGKKSGNGKPWGRS